MVFIFSLTSCGPPAEELAMTMVAATAEFESAAAVTLEQTKTDKPSETSKPTQSKHVDWEVFRDPVTGVSFRYPSAWELIDEPAWVILEADPGAIILERVDRPYDELEQVAEEMFELDTHYIEISRLQMLDPVGYMSTGHFENKSEELVRFLLAYPGYGLMHWKIEAPERSLLDEHLIIFEDILASVTLPVTGTKTQDGAANPLSTEASVEMIWKTPTLEVLSEHPEIDCMNAVFDIFVDVFGVYVVAPASSPLELVNHSANVLAQYIDNDADGVPDDLAVHEYLVSQNFVVPVWTMATREEFWENARGTYCEHNTGMAASMYYDEDEWALGGIQTAGTWDTNLEEIWHVVSVGWYASYPDYFGDSARVSSMLTDAMDVARGGRFFSIPERYPGNAWYTYDDETCDYGCQIHEYFYWILMANLDALDPSLTDKCRESDHEWHICNRAELEQLDVLAFDLLNNHGFSLPDRIPDGNYSPKVSVSQTDADQPTEMKETAEYDGTGMIDIVNVSNVDTAELQEWAAFAESKMASRRADILAVLWPVGDFVREGGFSHPFNQHEVLVTQMEVEFLVDAIDNWLSDQTCMKDDPEWQREEIEIYRDWIARGADASTQLSLCPDTRLVMMGLAPNHQSQTAWGRRDLQDFFVHELYHAFQQDLADESCRQQMDGRPRRDSNSPWIVEGGAAYFAEFVVSEINGESTPESNVLRNAFNAFRDEGIDIFQGAIDRTGAAALRLMVEQGHIDQADILDGSLFHDCDRERRYGNDNPYVVAAKDSWYLIEEQNDLYAFSEAAGVGGQSDRLDEASTTNTQAANEGSVSGPQNIPVYERTLCAGADVERHLVEMNEPLIDCLIEGNRSDAPPVVVAGAAMDPAAVMQVHETLDAGIEILGGWGPLHIVMVGINDPDHIMLAEHLCGIYDKNDLHVRGGSLETCVTETADEFSHYDCCGAVHNPPDPLSRVGLQSIQFSAPEIQYEEGRLRITTLHEYVHVFQNAQTVWPNELDSDADGRIRVYNHGMVWMEEGSAEFFAQYFGGQRGWTDYRANMKENLLSARKVRSEWGLSLRDVETRDGQARVRELCDCGGMLYYETGTWATAWLVNRSSVNAFLFGYFPRLSYDGWEVAFQNVFGLTMEEFYTEFEAFMDLPIEEQMAILP